MIKDPYYHAQRMKSVKNFLYVGRGGRDHFMLG